MVATRPVQAGFATKLMFQFDIGTARSLPWGSDWAQGVAEYRPTDVLRDLDGLLTRDTPVIVRLETLRRAVLYSSSDRTIARELFETVTARARAAAESGVPDVVALLDAAFVTDLFWQIGEHSNPPLTRQSRVVRGLVGRARGDALIRKFAASLPREPQFLFGAALVEGVRHLGETPFIEYARAALAGAAGDTVLSHNLDRIYADRLDQLSRQSPPAGTGGD